MSEKKSGGMNPALKVVLIVLGVVVLLGCGIVAVAVLIMGKSIETVSREATRMATRQQMEQVRSAISNYRLEHGELPPALTELVGTYIDSNRVPRDAWDNPFVYVRGDDGNTYELISYGADGVEGGEGDDADIYLE